MIMISMIWWTITKIVMNYFDFVDFVAVAEVVVDEEETCSVY